MLKQMILKKRCHIVSTKQKITNKPHAEANNASRGLNNSLYPAKTEFNNYFIMDSYQNNDLITTKKSNKVSQDKMFSKQRCL